MSYRPITDMWFLARAKLKGGKKYYGAYLGGFPERARVILGATIFDSVLHLCGGMAEDYPYKRGFGVNDKTLDLDPECEPDFCQDAREPLPLNNGHLWDAILIDPPYSEADAEYYLGGSSSYPKPYELVRNALSVIKIGGKVGIIHYQVPKMPSGAIFVACVGVVCGFQNRIRVFSVFEKT